MELHTRWAGAYPGAVGIIERDLDSLLRFYQWEACHWPACGPRTPSNVGGANVLCMTHGIGLHGRWQGNPWCHALRATRMVHQGQGGTAWSFRQGHPP